MLVIVLLELAGQPACSARQTDVGTCCWCCAFHFRSQRQEAARSFSMETLCGLTDD